MKKWRWIITCLVILCILEICYVLSLNNAILPVTNDSQEDIVFRINKKENVDIQLENISRQYKIVFVADLHLIIDNDEIHEDDIDTVKQRIGWSSFDGISAKDSLYDWVVYINSLEPDLVLLGGDMIDFCSDENCKWLKTGLDMLNAPYVYVRADHDSEPFYLSNRNMDDAYNRQMEIDSSFAQNVWYVEYEDFVVLAWNNSSSQLSEAGLDECKKAIQIGKPIILLTHVPIQSSLDDSLDMASKEIWQDRALIWGINTYYYPDGNTNQLLNYIYSDNNLIKEVLCGHLHFSWDGMLSESTHQHVFSAAYERNIGIINVY